MAERTLVDYVLRGMKPFWEWPVKHADAFTAGIADLSAYLPCAGTVWIELKALDRWPARPRSQVTFGLEPLQRHFLHRRRGWLFVRVGREYLLFDRMATYRVVDRANATQAKLRRVVRRVWTGRVDWNEFMLILLSANE